MYKFMFNDIQYLIYLGLFQTTRIRISQNSCSN